MSTTLLKIKNSEGTLIDLTSYIRSYELEYSDMDASTERNAKGISVRDFLRTTKTIKCTFRTVNPTMMTTIMNLTKQKELYLAYYDTETCTYSELQNDLLHAYASPKRTNAIYNSSNEVLFHEFSVEFTEF